MSGLPYHFIFGHSVNRRSAFTLVEMLAVMGIIVLLLFATLPAFNGFNQSQSRSGAVSSLMGTLDRARMMAISDGLATYVVFACKTSGTQQVNSNLWGRGYAIFQDSDNINYVPVQRTAWMYLPVGIAFKVDAKDSAPPSITYYVPDSNDPSAPSFPVSGSAMPTGSSGAVSVYLPYWKFDNTGVVNLDTAPPDPSARIAYLIAYLRVFLFPGYVDGSGNEVSQNSGGSTNNALLSEIDINQSTGRAKYIVDPLNNLTTPSPTP